MIILSLTGARLSPSFQTRQAQILSVILTISDFLKLISISTLTHSPVAAGEVIALEKLFGIVIQREARIGTRIMVVSFPGTPQILYLVATIPGKRYISPVYAVALVV